MLRSRRKNLTPEKIPPQKLVHSKYVGRKIAFNSCTWHFYIFRWRPADVSIFTLRDVLQIAGYFVVHTQLKWGTGRGSGRGGLSGTNIFSRTNWRPFNACKQWDKKKSFLFSSVFFFVRREKTASWSRNGSRPMFVYQINRRQSNPIQPQLISCVLDNYMAHGWSCEWIKKLHCF